MPLYGQSFANQALAVRYITENKLEPMVHKIPKEIDERIARLKLETMDMAIDQLSKRQKEYIEGWGEGT